MWKSGRLWKLMGTLYYSWNGLRGSAVTSSDAYGPSQIDRLTFVAADGFHGVVRIPFTGTSWPL